MLSGASCPRLVNPSCSKSRGEDPALGESFNHLWSISSLVGVCAEIRVPTRVGRISAASVPLRDSEVGWWSTLGGDQLKRKR